MLLLLRVLLLVCHGPYPVQQHGPGGGGDHHVAAQHQDEVVVPAEPRRGVRGPVGDETLGADGLLVVLEVEDPVLQPPLHVED